MESPPPPPPAQVAEQYHPYPQPSENPPMQQPHNPSFGSKFARGCKKVAKAVIKTIICYAIEEALGNEGE